jgi:hypothetical protein
MLVEGRYDPTARMKGLSLAPRPKSDARWYQAPATTARLAAEASVGRSLGRTSAVLVAVVVLALAGVIFAFGTLDHRCLAVGALLMWAGLLGAGLFFSFQYGLWAQGTFGERRLFEYASLPLVLIGATALQIAAERLEGRRSLAGRALGIAAALVALLLSLRSLGVSDERGTMRYIAAAATTPCDTRLLVDHVTRGSFQALAGRISVTEGLVPFLRPDLVNEAVALREESRAFFKSPEDSPRLLAREEVDFVLTTRADRLERADSLRFVREVDGVSVYEVDRTEGGERLPRPTASPGYDCLMSPSQ